MLHIFFCRYQIIHNKKFNTKCTQMHVVRVDMIPLPRFEGSCCSLFILCPSRESVCLQAVFLYITRSDCMFFTLPYIGSEKLGEPPCLYTEWPQCHWLRGFSPPRRGAGVLLDSCCPRQACAAAPLRPVKQKAPLPEMAAAVILCPLPCGGVLLSTTCLHVYSCLQFLSSLDSKNSVPLPHQVYCSRHTINIDWTAKLINMWMNDWGECLVLGNSSSICTN